MYKQIVNSNHLATFHFDESVDSNTHNIFTLFPFGWAIIIIIHSLHYIGEWNGTRTKWKKKIIIIIIDIYIGVSIYMNHDRAAEEEEEDKKKLFRILSRFGIRPGYLFSADRGFFLSLSLTHEINKINL